MISTLRKTISLLTIEERRNGFKILMIVIVMAILDTAGVASVMPFLAVLGNPDIITTNTFLLTIYTNLQKVGIVSQLDFLIFLGAGTFSIILLSAFFRFITLCIINRFLEMRRHSIELRLLQSYLNRKYAFFLNRHSGELSKSILSEVDQIVGHVLGPSFYMLANIIVLIIIVAFLFFVDPWTATLSGCTLIGLYTIVFLALKKRMSELGRIRVESNKNRFKAANEVFAGIKIIKQLACENSYIQRFKLPSHQFAASHATHISNSQIPKIAIECICFGGVIVVVMVLMVNAGGLSNDSLGKVLPVVGLYVFAAYRLLPALQSIYSGVSGLRFGKVAVDNVFHDFFGNAKVVKTKKCEVNPIFPSKRIVFKKISYSYPNAKHKSLHDINFEIPMGCSIGIVGKTGSGKTTLIDIILGLLNPTDGAIVIDGHTLTNENIPSWQKCLGYVPQEIVLTDASISENVALGISKNEIDLERVKLCAQLAQISKFIDSELPDQYNTIVGERGVRLSGGQRQRIGIARALYNDPEILIFDEATSALDGPTEKGVMDSINKIMRVKTTIMIAHRLSTIKNCDHILILENGSIKLIGNYQDAVSHLES